ncbi:RNA 2',3'-cyclic phosphodiesterase [Dermatobacter hominis]|uniref:RNA 2',3'-cyclic phosphodiesterase n=1 Tax=Dermatobacter hominis TaxID=2884263 RepID=UPI001D0FEC4A|nr:RNA 2',3'-cyclic phosphodiesterase [Dermatobacter hominis]UDY34314.1 RNA 2',3'-cyclic phosphodiesterase [Dermatobacter hominis]
MSTARLFLAVWPPDDVVEELMTLRRKDQRGVRFVPPDRWHITLRFFGEARVDEVEAAMDDVELPSATARLGPAVDVIGERALVVPVGGLEELAARVTAATRSIGEPPPRRPFHGHLTIARVKRDARMPPALGAMVDGRFRVDEVALVRSRLDPDGARYDTVAAWALPS